MSNKIRECVKGLSQSKNVQTLLPEYVNESVRIHRDYAKIKLMMEYYVFYEMVSEGINPYLDSAKDIAQQLNQVIYQIFEEGSVGIEEVENTINTLERLRQQVTERMQVLTAYVDRFVIYEYILNRVQYRFEDQEMMPEDPVFAQEVLNFIFSTKDNMAINDNIRAVLGQLPMRMARSRYYDLIRDSISVYKGSDVSSLEGYLYMFRTNAMLYRTPAMEEHFTEFIPVLKELEQLNYDTLSKEAYEIYAGKIQANASKLNDISDLYMLLQQLLNEVYAIALSLSYSLEEEKMSVVELVVRGINALCLERECSVWDNAGEELATEEEKLGWLGEHFVAIEGLQEQAYDSMNVADAVLDEFKEAHKEEIEKTNLKEAFVVLGKMQQLLSNSAFADLEAVEEEEKVTSQTAEQTAEKLIEELKQAFKGQSRMVRRAIMANTLEKIPVFFTTPQEVADYVSQSLSLCDDEAEKYAAKQLIQSLME